MTKSARNICAAAVIGIGAALAGGAPALAVTIKEGPVCKSDVSDCTIFDDTTNPIPAILYHFTASSAGTALLMFNGWMRCENFSGTNDAAHGVIDLEGQILTGGTPDYAGPGGSRIALRLPPAGAANYSAAINLASSRVFAVTSGTNIFRFKLAKLRMDPQTRCTLYNGNFTVVFTP